MPDMTVNVTEDEIQTGVGPQLFSAIDYLQQSFAAQP